MATNSGNPSKPMDWAMKGPDHRYYFFSELLKRPVCAGKIGKRLGKLTDLVFQLSEPYPLAVGIFLSFGWGVPTQFIPWDRVVKIDDDAIFVQPPPEGETYPPFVDQPGWILVDQHLMGKTILDMDGRRTEVVNDVHLLETQGRMLIGHVDISFNGFLRKWGLGRFHWFKDQLISWKFVQPLSVEDVTASDVVSLSVTRSQIRELPPEDLADALEELSGEEQQAVFSTLDSEKAAETLMEAEPRAQRQIIANLRQERARNILSEMSVAQLADLFSVLPHNEKTDLGRLLPQELAGRVQAILSEQEATVRLFVSTNCVTMLRETSVGEALRICVVELRSRHDFLHLRGRGTAETPAGRGRSPRTRAGQGRSRAGGHHGCARRQCGGRRYARGPGGTVRQVSFPHVARRR